MITSDAIVKEKPINLGYSNKIYPFNDGIVHLYRSTFVNSDVNHKGISWEIDVYGDKGFVTLYVNLKYVVVAKRAGTELNVITACYIFNLIKVRNTSPLDLLIVLQNCISRLNLKIEIEKHPSPYLPVAIEDPSFENNREFLEEFSAKINTCEDFCDDI